MKEKITSQYLLVCKEYYKNGVIPAISLQNRDENYNEIRELALQIIRENGIMFFSDFFQEGQYLVQLWTAHLIMEDINASDELKRSSLLIIQDYSDNPLVPKVSEAENLWLKKFYPSL